MERTISLDIPMTWSWARDGRLAVEDALRDAPAEVRYAAAMAASELVENAIKYGEGVPGQEKASFRLAYAAPRLRIQVANGLRSAEAARALMATVAQIASSGDRETLYLQRLRAMFDEPHARGGLGLLRVSHEGRFELSAEYVDGILTITATRDAP